MSATIFLEAGHLTATNPTIWPVIGAGIFLAGATVITIGAAFVADFRKKPKPPRDLKLASLDEGSDPWIRLQTLCAAGSAGVVKRRDQLRDATTNALRQALDQLSDEERAQARDRGLEWRR